MGVGAQFNRVKNWVEKEILNNFDLNEEINNILRNFKPAGMDDYSLTVSQMQETQSPGSVASEVQPTTLAEEIKALRYMVKAIIGGAQWYSSPPSNLTLLNTTLSTPSNRVISGAKDANNFPIYLQAHGAAATATLAATATDFVAYIGSTLRTFDADISVTGLATAPSSNNTCLVNYPNLAVDQSSKVLGEGDSVIPIDNVGTEISSLNGRYAAFKVGSTEYFLALIDTTNGQLKNVMRGYFFDSTEAWVPRLGIADNATITLLRPVWMFATYNSSTPGVDISYNKPTVSYDQPSGSIGDFWFDLANSVWKKFSGVAWVTQEAIYIGVVALDSTNCVAARSADFYHSVSGLNEIEIERTSSNSIRARQRGSRVAVYGVVHDFVNDQPSWSISADFDSGVTEAASTAYYAYVTDLGDRILSDVAPHDRRADLGGFYHPGRPWRCVGEVFNDASQDLETVSPFSPSSVVIPDYHGLNNVAFKTSVAANALTVELCDAQGCPPSPMNPLYIPFRKSDAASSLWTVRKVTGPVKLIVPSSATLGHPSAMNAWVHVWVIDNDDGSVQLGLSGTRLTSDVTHHNRVTSTAMSAGATSHTLVYSLSVATTKAIKYIGAGKSSQTVAGTWATALSNYKYNRDLVMDGARFEYIAGGSHGHGSGATKVRRLDVTAGTVSFLGDDYFSVADDSTNGTVWTIRKEGLWSLIAADGNSAGAVNWGLSRNAGNSTTNFASITADLRLGGVGTPTNGCDQCAVIVRLKAGDEIRMHDAGTNNQAIAKIELVRISD